MREREANPRILGRYGVMNVSDYNPFQCPVLHSDLKAGSRYRRKCPR